MNINKTNITKKEQQNFKQLSKELFKLCFDDSAEFVDFYFRKRYTNENNFAILRNNAPVAALQAIPYSMTFFDKHINLAYLSAICTHPDFRNQGLMTQLLRNTYNQLFADNIIAAILIPAELWLFDIYKKYDFETLFYRSKKQIDTSILSKTQNCRIYDFTTFDKHKAFQYFDTEMHKRNGCIQHSLHNFEAACEDIYNSDGIILIAECENEISGMLFVTKINENVTVIEHFADTDEISNNLFKSSSQKMQNDNIFYFDFPQKHNSTAVGMIRIICAEKMLQLYAITHPCCKKNISLADNLIVENNGCYTISNAQCKKSPLVDEKNAWNIAQLTHFIFEKQVPYMSLMMHE